MDVRHVISYFRARVPIFNHFHPALREKDYQSGFYSTMRASLCFLHLLEPAFEARKFRLIDLTPTFRKRLADVFGDLNENDVRRLMPVCSTVLCEGLRRSW